MIELLENNMVVLFFASIIFLIGMMGLFFLYLRNFFNFLSVQFELLHGDFLSIQKEMKAMDDKLDTPSEDVGKWMDRQLTLSEWIAEQVKDFTSKRPSTDNKSNQTNRRKFKQGRTGDEPIYTIKQDPDALAVDPTNPPSILTHPIYPKSSTPKKKDSSGKEMSRRKKTNKRKTNNMLLTD